MALALAPLARACAIISVLGVFGSACSDSKEPTPLPADELSFEIFPTTTILGPSELDGLAASPDGKLSFSVAPASLAKVEVGSVIVAGVSASTPRGLLRYVSEVTRTGTGLEMKTMQAPIALAFRKLHVASQRDIGLDAAPPNRADLRPRGIGFDAAAEQPLDFLLFDADNDPSTTNDQIGIRGSIGGGFHFAISVDVDWGDVFDVPNAVKTCLADLANPLKIVDGKPPDCSPTALLPEAKVKFEANPFMRAHASLYGAASLSYEKDFDVASIPLSPIPIGPLVFFPTVDITAKVAGSAGAGFTVGAHGEVALESSVAISSKHPESPDIVPIAVRKVDFAADDTKVILQASAKVGLGARLAIELYGVVGPYAQATTYAEVKANAFDTPCWSLHVGVDTVLGVRVTTPEIPFVGSLSLLDWKGLELTPIDRVVSTGACLPVEKGPPLPPGSGPDALTYANPTFVPWAHVTTPVGDDGAVKSFLVDGAEWTDASLAIDGRFVTVGTRNESIVKLDDSGKLVWSHRYRREAPTPLLRLRRAVPTHDASMMVLTEAQDGEGASVLKIGQAGGVWFRKRIALDPAAGCAFLPFSIVRDAGTGFFVLGQCNGDRRAALVHLDANAVVLGAELFGDANPSDRSITPSAMATVGNDVIVMGASSTTAEGTRMFAIRLDDSESPAWANRVIGCPDALDLHPSDARVNGAGQLTVVGTAANHRGGLLMRLKDDGSVVFANVSRFDKNGDNPFNLHAFAELPTTGVLVAGSTQNLGLPSGDPGTETSLLLASLDSTGRTLWANRYTLPNQRSLNHASLRLTDDGGAIVTGIAQHTAQPGGSLFAMKAFAKDGDLRGAPGVTVAPMAVVDPIACPVAVVPWAASVTRISAVSTDVPTLSEDGAVRIE